MRYYTLNFILLFGLFNFLSAEKMVPGKWIEASKSVKNQGLKQYGSVFGNCDHGDWISFGPINLEDGLVDRVEVKLASPNNVGKIEVRLGGLQGSLVGEVSIRETGGYDKFGFQQGFSEQLAGHHQLFVIFKGGKNLCNFSSIRFLKPGQKATKGSLAPNEQAKTTKGLSLNELLSINDEVIKDLRTQELKILAPPGARVEIKQIKHYFEFGTAINKNGFSPNDKITSEEQLKYQKVILENFNSVVHENAMKWYSNERKKGVQNFQHADRMLAWAEENELITRGHCVYWGRDKLVPKWQKEISDVELRKKLKERAKLYMTRFSNLKEHDINNEMVHCTYYKKRLGNGIWKQMFDWCAEYDPNAILYVNDYSILSGGDTPKYIKQIDGFLKAGMKVGGIGVQGHFGGGLIKHEEIKAKLDQLGRFNLPIKITEFDVNTSNEARKAESLATVYITAFAHPSVEGIYMWGFWKKMHWRPNAALWNEDWSETSSAKIYRKLVFDKWWSQETLKTNLQGENSTRVFFGKHKITIDGKSKLIELKPDLKVTSIDARESDPKNWVLK